MNDINDNIIRIVFEYLRVIVEYFNFGNFLENNPPIRLLVLGAIVLAMLVVAHFICKFIEKRLKAHVAAREEKRKTGAVLPEKPEAMPRLDMVMFARVMRDAKWLIYLFILGWGLKRLILAPPTAAAISILVTTFCTLVGISFCVAIVPFNMDLYLRRRGSTLGTSQAKSLVPIIKGVIWAVGLTFLLDNIGCQVSTIIAGLGIMGVAVGLAGQAILRDFFSYIVILFDKPFRIGDFLVLEDGKRGNVIYIGPKTTRLRNLEDNIIICANSEMTSKTLVNLGNIREREVELEIGVSFNMAMPIVRKVPEILKEVVNSIPKCRFERACMLKFGTANYIFQLIYKVDGVDGGVTEFMNIQSEVNLSIQEKLDKENIVGAYPTEYVILQNQEPPAPLPEKPAHAAPAS